MVSKGLQNSLNLGGLKTVLLTLLWYVLLFVVNLLVIGGSIVSMLGDGLNDLPANLGTGLLTFAIMGLVNAVLAILISAGQLGSFKDAAEGTGFSFAGYWANCKTYFLRVLGYGVLCGIITLILGIVLIGLPAGKLSYLWLVLGQLIFSVLINAYILPQFYLLVAKYELKGFVVKRFLPLLVYALIIWLLTLIPIIGAVCSAILQLFYPLFVFVLYKEHTGASKAKGNPV